MTSTAKRTEKLTALPSLSCSLSSLPQATSLDGISLHHSMFAQRAAESEAKLKKALSKTASSPQAHNAIPPYMVVPQPNPSSPGSEPPLMMKSSKILDMIVS
ncbi:hypothetical protein CONPUDRAFT_169053 [Coniophora puteana RWD-64-598 SS2]|uniref:Uncharacterized protein n=1 Tax=Coniophora puteana (strain RWD-64-598) TaxID=741705 RepID=A0A5M3M923_CONPW|nr:uncharacterized protein CONPUDRAFT_169053 [Coniophora puteana RWD-64-598 SS2]EIW75772.1 hypothetical protein CONPUDRAFT_169053 [Coniophora puteana RWD-64-598 SS2]